MFTRFAGVRNVMSRSWEIFPPPLLLLKLFEMFRLPPSHLKVSIAVGLAGFACVMLVVLFLLINKYGRRSKFGMKGKKSLLIYLYFNHLTMWNLNATGIRKGKKRPVFITSTASKDGGVLCYSEGMLSNNAELLKRIKRRVQGGKRASFPPRLLSPPFPSLLTCFLLVSVD